MTIDIYRFPLSHFSEKGRALLDFKKVDYQIVERQLGLPQLDVFRRSGQRKVPIIDHEGRVVAGTTKIALYLDEVFDQRRLVPEDPKLRGEVLALDRRLNRTFGIAAPTMWFQWVLTEPEFAECLKLEVFGLPGVGARGLGAAFRAAGHLPPVGRFYQRADRALRKMLGELDAQLQESTYLFGDSPTLADVTAATLCFHLEFPQSRHFPLPDLIGRGVPGLADAPEFARFFGWRRDFYARFLG